MGLLDKHNPSATRESARSWAIGGRIVGGLFSFFGWLSCWSHSDMPLAEGFFFVPFMAFSGAVTGWAIEWQLPPDAEAVNGTEADVAVYRASSILGDSAASGDRGTSCKTLRCCVTDGDAGHHS